MKQYISQLFSQTWLKCFALEQRGGQTYIWYIQFHSITPWKAIDQWIRMFLKWLHATGNVFCEKPHSTLDLLRTPVKMEWKLYIMPTYPWQIKKQKNPNQLKRSASALQPVGLITMKFSSFFIAFALEYCAINSWHCTLREGKSIKYKEQNME